MGGPRVGRDLPDHAIRRNRFLHHLVQLPVVQGARVGERVRSEGSGMWEGPGREGGQDVMTPAIVIQSHYHGLVAGLVANRGAGQGQYLKRWVQKTIDEAE